MPNVTPQAARWRSRPSVKYRYKNRYMSRMKNVAKLSIVAMRVCVRCMKSNASSAAPHRATRSSRNIRRSRSHISGQHGHAEERAHEAPAERRHAEEHDAEREDLLAERRVRDFIRIHAAQVLIGRACVVDLIKIRTVVVRGRGGHGVRFVAERVRARRAGDGAHADAAALRVVECELAELHVRARRDAHIGRRCGRGVGHFRLKPLEEVGVALAASFRRA